MRTLTLKLDGKELTAEKFVKSVSAFVAIIKDVTESLSGEQNSVKWIVTVEKGSAVLHFTPRSVRVNPEVVQSAIRAVTNGFREIEEQAGRPSHWSDASLKHAKEIASVYDPNDQALDTIRVLSDGEAAFATVTKATSVNVDSLVVRERKSLGTIEGRLRAITESGGIHVVVQDQLSHANVRCYIEENDIEKFVAAFRHRVSVYGEIKYGSDNRPSSIKAMDIRVFRDRVNLPSISDITGIYV